MKARCPVCLREITVNERRELREHNRRRSRRGQEPERCPGSGDQPADQARLPVPGEHYDPGSPGIPY